MTLNLEPIKARLEIGYEWKETAVKDLQSCVEEIERLRSTLKLCKEGLEKTQWGDGQSCCCQICDAFNPAPHKKGCVVGKALTKLKEVEGV